jgi:RNA polymerase sigma factor (sigma-70 family)
MERGEGAGGVFPPTRWSAVVAARSGEQAERKRGLSRIAEAYWRPVYKLLRLRWNKSHEDARELTQEFFARLLEDDLLASYDPAKGRLRTFLRTCLDALVMNDERDRARLKRGGDREIVPLDCEQAERELSSGSLAAPADADAFFEAEWVRSVFALAVARLRAECLERGRAVAFEVFDRYDLQDRDPRPTYAEIAAELSIKVTDVTNHLALARREMRRITLETLREMTVSDEEFRREARTLLGIDPGQS